MLFTSDSSSLSVGIYVSVKTISFCAIQNNEKLSALSFKASADSFSLLEEAICRLLHKHPCTALKIMLISRSPLGYPLANFLSANPVFLPYNPALHCLAPAAAGNAYSLALLANQRRLCLYPWRGFQYLTLQTLTRRRYYLIHALHKEKEQFLSHIFSQISTPSSAPLPNLRLLTFHLSPERLALASPLKLVDFLFCHTALSPSVAEQIHYLIKQAKRSSFRLDQCSGFNPPLLYAASLYNSINAYEQEILALDKLIQRTFQGLNPPAALSLLSLPGMDALHVALLLSELGDLLFFPDSRSFSSYLGEFDYPDLYQGFSPDNLQFLRCHVTAAAEKVLFHQKEDDFQNVSKLNRPALFLHNRSLSDITSEFSKIIFPKTDTYI